MERCILILKNTNTALNSIKNELLNGGFSIAGWVEQPTLSVDLTQAIKAYGHDYTCGGTWNHQPVLESGLDDEGPQHPRAPQGSSKKVRKGSIENSFSSKKKI